MRRAPHENVATVLVAPHVLGDLELELMALDMRVWPVRTAPVCVDGPRMEFQVRRRLLMKHRGQWDVAADWTPVWIGFGPSWHNGDEPLPWRHTMRSGECSTCMPSTCASTGGSGESPDCPSPRTWTCDEARPSVKEA